MSFLISLFGGIWGKVATIVVGAVGLLTAFLGMRYKIRKTAKEEMRTEIQERTLEQIREAEKVSQDVDAMPDGDILDKLRDNGWVR